MKLLPSVVLSIAVLASRVWAESCSYDGRSGTCMTPSACASANRWWVPNQCSGGDSNRCCLSSTRCNASPDNGGYCLRTDTPGKNKCAANGGAQRAGLCPGPDEVQCCVVRETEGTNGNSTASTSHTTTSSDSASSDSTSPASASPASASPTSGSSTSTSPASASPSSKAGLNLNSQSISALSILYWVFGCIALSYIFTPIHA
ncbi:hypothetical protein PSPO01_10736 [Paraphaeosphaeria sporulosa]